MRRILIKSGVVMLVLFVLYILQAPSEQHESRDTEEKAVQVYRTGEATSKAKFEIEISDIEEKVEKVKLPEHFCYWMQKEVAQSDYELLCRTTWCESGNQDLETQTMVCLTILNRWNDGFGETITDVVYGKNAYSVTNWENFEEYGWTEQVEQAVNIALRENTHPRNMYYFRTKHYHTFGKPYMVSDDLWFSTQN